MTGQLTMYGAQRLLSGFFGQSYVIPSEFYMALIKNATPTAYLNGSELDEPVGSNYQRAYIRNSSTSWANTAGNIVTNDIEIAFPTATQDWGTIRHWALCDALADGNPFIVGTMDVVQKISAGDQFRVAVGDLDIEIGPFYATWES